MLYVDLNNLFILCNFLMYMINRIKNIIIIIIGITDEYPHATFQEVVLIYVVFVQSIYTHILFLGFKSLIAKSSLSESITFYF